MGGPDVFKDDLAVFGSLRQEPGPDVVAVEIALDSLADRRIGRASIMGLKLESIEDGWIVAGGDHDSADRALGFDREGNGGGWRRLGS